MALLSSSHHELCFVLLQRGFLYISSTKHINAYKADQRGIAPQQISTNDTMKGHAPCILNLLSKLHLSLFFLHATVAFHPCGSPHDLNTTMLLQLCH